MKGNWAFWPVQLAGNWAHLANVGAFARTKRVYLYCDRSLPPFTNEKKTTSTPDLRRRMASPYQRFFLPRVFPHDVSRTEREFVRARRRPGLPRGQFSGPWLFSTAEARTSNSPSSAREAPKGLPGNRKSALYNYQRPPQRTGKAPRPSPTTRTTKNDPHSTTTTQNTNNNQHQER